MELNNSINKQQSPNFGMALVIEKKAQPFIESLPSAERKYLHELGKRIKGSRNDINILEDGKVTLTYRPKASDIRLVNDGNRAAFEAEDKIKREKFKKELNPDEKIYKILEDFKTIKNVLKIKLFSRESKFMKRLKIAEELQKASDRDDALQIVVEKRIASKDAAAKKDAESLMSEFGEK